MSETLASVMMRKREELNREWETKHPNGAWSIQRFHGFALSWYKHRPVSGSVRCDGVTAKWSSYNYVDGERRPLAFDASRIHVVSHRNNSFGRVTYYTSAESFFAACVRLRIPPELVAAFRYGVERLGRGEKLDFY